MKGYPTDPRPGSQVSQESTYEPVSYYYNLMSRGLACLCSCSGTLWRINLRELIGLVTKGKGGVENVMVVLLKIVEIVVTAWICQNLEESVS